MDPGAVPLLAAFDAAPRDALLAVADAARANEPVLIMDDGGVATRIVAEKFAKQAHRVTIVEQTDAGHRRTLEHLQRDGKLPFTYWLGAKSFTSCSTAGP